MSKKTDPTTKQDLEDAIAKAVDEIARVTSTAISYEIGQLRKALATKDELRSEISNVREDISDVQEDIRRLVTSSKNILKIIETNEARWKEAGNVNERLTRLEKRAFA